MNLYRYYVQEDGGVIQVKSNRRPSYETMPRSGSWIVRELQKDGTWQMPCFPEIGYGHLSKLIYLGVERIPKKNV